MLETDLPEKRQLLGLRISLETQRSARVVRPVHCDTPWYIVMYRGYTVVHGGTRWYTVVHCGTLWYTVVHCGTLWYTVVHCGTLWYTVVHHGALWCTVVRRGTPPSSQLACPFAIVMSCAHGC